MINSNRRFFPPPTISCRCRQGGARGGVAGLPTGSDRPMASIGPTLNGEQKTFQPSTCQQEGVGSGSIGDMGLGLSNHVDPIRSRS